MKAVFITNFCPHYRQRTFELLAESLDVEFLFFSLGKETYWQHQHGVRSGEFRHRYLRGFRVGHTRITPGLVWQLLTKDYDVVVKCINGKFALPVTYLLARLRRRPFVLWTGVWSDTRTPFHRFARPLTRRLCLRADAVAVYGEHVRRYLREQGVPGEKLFVAPHAVENGWYTATVPAQDREGLRRRLGARNNQAIILYLGRLEPAKGLEYLLEAFAQVPFEALLVVAGAGSEEQRLRELSASLGIADRVRFVGYVPPERTIDYYSVADLLALPSVTTAEVRELWGLVVNEAFNQGLPVVVSESVGAAAGGLVQNGVNGIVVRERNSEELAAALTVLISNPEQRRRFGENGRAAVKLWSNEAMVQGFLEAMEFACRSKVRS